MNIDHACEILANRYDWFTGPRPHQVTAVEHAVDAYRRGVRMVLIDAPTGSGKTVIGELVRMVLGADGLYVCHGIELQHQFARDFDAPVLKGRANYPTVNRPDLTADHCQGRICNLCPTQRDCPYQQAREAAVKGNPAVLNTAYFLTEANGPGRMTGRGLVVMDEADTIEGELLRWAQFRVGPWKLKRLGMRAPRKGVRWSTMHDWLSRVAMTSVRLAGEAAARQDFAEQRSWMVLADQVNRFFPADVDPDNWVRDYGDGAAVTLKPVVVDGFGRDHLWRHGRRWLLMSATMIGPEWMLRDVGWDEDWEIVRVPSTFPVESRQVVAVPVASMTRRGREGGEWERGVEAVVRLVGLHRERMLVHTVSYELAAMVVDALCEAGWGGRVVTYRSAADRAEALRMMRAREGTVLVAPSMDRGVDLPGDLCRVQVVLKVPYPNLGDRRVGLRMRRDGGRVWYDLQTVRSLVQMTGRGMRSEDDWVVTYVLDREFVKGWGRWRGLVPEWWGEAVVLDRSPREVLNGGFVRG